MTAQGAYRWRIAALLGAAVLCLTALPRAGAAQADTARRDAARPVAARPVDSASAHGTVRADTLWAQALGVRKQFLVYLPPSYAVEPDRRYPVAYYLHGLYGSEADWVQQGRIARTLDSLIARGMPELLVVMPDGDDGWYTTWNTLGDVGACRAAPHDEPAASYCVPWPHYDDYVARDLVAYVDSTYRTLPARAHRGIAGLSMGGYGAVALALAYPDVFSAAASHSGTLSPRHRPTADSTTPPGEAYATGVEEMARIWGGMWPRLHPAFGSDTSAWQARDPATLLRRLLARSPATVPALYLDVGRDDPLAHQTRDFERTLRSLEVPHTYVTGPGGHDWGYWRRQVGESLRWLAERL
ncbi:MAG TPA: alpha/beta hydrolase family protein [Gemmatimonadaceae bacterium]|nr:alpha/beta hydrolase family protein [Gemmatimonadaceae bacterium]